MGDGSCAFQIIRSRVHTTCTRDVCITLGHVTDKDECRRYGVHTMSPLEDFPAKPLLERVRMDVLHFAWRGDYCRDLLEAYK